MSWVACIVCWSLFTSSDDGNQRQCHRSAFILLPLFYTYTHARFFVALFLFYRFTHTHIHCTGTKWMFFFLFRLTLRSAYVILIYAYVDDGWMMAMAVPAFYEALQRLKKTYETMNMYMNIWVKKAHTTIAFQCMPAYNSRVAFVLWQCVYLWASKKKESFW